MILLMEASISSMEGSRCALLAVAIVTSAALVTPVGFRSGTSRIRIMATA